jgi:galactoside O-acetyltransferase
MGKGSNVSVSEAHYSEHELRALGLAQIGRHVQIDRTCRLFGPSHIRIGSNVRIDAYTVITAGGPGVTIGDYVHISTHASIMGSGGVTLEDFTGISARVSIFSTNDDYSGGAMTNPMIPDEFRHVTARPVVIRRHAIVGCGSVILPGVELGEGASVGALTLVNRSVPEFLIVSGNPMRRVGERNRRLLELERQFNDRVGRNATDK